jgi:hypothetical protein
MKMMVTVCCALMLIMASSGTFARSSRGSRNHPPAQQASEPKVIDIAAIARAQATGAGEPVVQPSAQPVPASSMIRSKVFTFAFAGIVSALLAAALLYVVRRVRAKAAIPAAAPATVLPPPAVASVVAPAIVSPPVVVREHGVEPARSAPAYEPSYFSEASSDSPVDLAKVAKMLGVGIGELKLAVHLRNVVAEQHLEEVAA